jgi:phage baseplate assembly protein W
MAEIAFFKDLSLDFTPHPVSGDVRPIINETAIKRSLMNLIRTKKGTRPFNPEYGCDLSEYLFSYEPGFSEFNMKQEILDSIVRNEPRVIVDSIVIKYEEYGITLDIQYIIKNINRVGSITTSLTRAA